MKLTADYHTHSKHSRFWHGRNTIIEMSYRANELGLQELAITDHGFKHLFRTNKEKLYDARLTIDDLNKWSKTKILLGIEADIIDENGTLDIDMETLALIDVLIVGYHKMIKTDFAGYFGKQENTPEAKQKATNAFLNAIEKYPVSIVAHLDSILTTDMYQIGKACAEKGALIEINNRHTNWTQEQMDELLASGCSFVLSSDAHCVEDVGNVQNALDIMLKYHIPSEKIINVEFEYNEKTDEHKELDRLYNEYKRKQNQIETRQREVEEQREFSTIKLSKEMEDALAQIEREQRGDYSQSTTQTDSKETSQSDEVAEETAEESEEGEDETSDETYAENTDRFLNAINRMSDALSPDSQTERAGGEAQTGSEQTLTETSETEVEERKEEQVETSKEETEPEKTEAAEPQTVQDEKPKARTSGKLKSGKAEIELNVKRFEPKKPARESSPEEVKNLFSVNTETEKNSGQKVESQPVSPNKSKPNSKKNKAGAFVDIASLTGEDDGEN